MAEEKEKTGVELTEIPTGTQPAFKLPDGSIVDGTELLLWIANQVHEIRRSL